MPVQIWQQVFYFTYPQSGTIPGNQSYHTTPFGEAWGANAPTDEQGFTGHVEDATGITYMQARYYDPVIGRFLSPDPIGYADQLNLYAYVRNDPVNLTDPTGTEVLFGCTDNGGGAHAFSCTGSLSRSEKGPTKYSSGTQASSTNNVQSVREEIVDQAEQALDRDEPYGLNDRNGNFGPGSYKCNKFVCDVSNAAGANIDLNVDQHGNAWPPLAGTFGNPNAKIRGWKTVDTPAPGDIVAQQRGYSDASGHVGIIVDADLNVISARDTGLNKAPLNLVFPENYRNGTIKTGPIVFWRYVGE